MSKKKTDFERIQEREAPGAKGPWKWQLIEAVNNVELKLDALLQALELNNKRSETARKLSEAGKKSAATRRAKYGTATPGKIGPVDLLGEPLHEPVREIKKSRKVAGVATPGSLVWDAYSMAYRNRYGMDPLRNAKVNGQCSQIANQVGADTGRELAAYYLTRNDVMYVKSSHTLGLCLLDLQKLNTERYNGNVVTFTDAKRMESASQTDRAIRQYMAEQDREGVRDVEVENAAQ